LLTDVLRVKMTASFGLVADVGGTNIRLSLVSLVTGELDEIKSYLCKDFPTILDVFREYLSGKDVKVQHGCIDVACPVDDDLVELTNNHWKFSKEGLCRDLALETLHVINDYTAIAMSIPGLGSRQRIKIGGGEPVEKGSIAVFGPGTGLGVAFLKLFNQQWVCFEGEGGHVDFAPHSELEDFMLNRLRKGHQHVSSERFMAGPGLIHIYQSIMAFHGETPEELVPAEITRRAVEGKDKRCQETLSLFCEMLGSFAGNLALTIWASGGVYIAGGIAPRITEFIGRSGFRDRFEAKGRFKDKIKSIPTYIITEPQPGLLGTAAYLMQMIDSLFNS
jgi:glucokinase